MSTNYFETSPNEQISGDSGSTCRKINSLLNSTKSRFEGLRLLNSILQQCSDDDFVRFCISWMQNCCKIEGLTGNKDYAIQLLNDLFKLSSNYQELKKSVSFFITTRYFDFFFKHFLHSQAGWHCTETCMLLYRGACGPFQESLEKHLKFEIGKNVKISSTVAHCYALLPSVGGGGNEGISYRKNWKTWFLKFLSITHSLLRELFACVDELQEYKVPEHVFECFQNESNHAYLTVQIHNHCSVLGCMLLNEFPAPKSIPTDLLLQLICRGLAVTPKALAHQPTTDSISLSKVLPQIHCSFLTLLTAVIVTCKSQLLPYSHLVCQLIRQSLEWTESELMEGKEKPFGPLRVSAYEVLCNWLTATGNGSCAEVISSGVISSAVSDVMSKKRVVSLKEAKHRSPSIMNREQTSRRISRTANDRLCHAALKALQYLLKFAGVLLKPEEHQFLQENTVKLILLVQRSTSDTIVPFSVSSCRQGLYAVLVELVLQPCPNRPPPTHFALQLLSRGLNDGCPRVSSYCSMALSMMSIIIHPQYSNGGFPSSEEPGGECRREVELEWKNVSGEGENESPAGVMEESVVDPKGGEIEEEQCVVGAGMPESGEFDSVDKTSNLGDESGASTNEDSRNTVHFSKSATEESVEKNDEDEGEEAQERCPSEVSPAEGEPSAKVRRTATENSPVETSKVLEMKLVESDQSEPPSSVKSISPESASEEGKMRKRYFLRSKTKGSSEEPEEAAMKRTISLDSLRSTPSRGHLHRGSPIVMSAAKRPRTRASAKIETTTQEQQESNNDAEPTALKKPPVDDDDDDDDDDDEDILAAFDDSLAD